MRHASCGAAHALVALPAAGGPRRDGTAWAAVAPASQICWRLQPEASTAHMGLVRALVGAAGLEPGAAWAERGGGTWGFVVDAGRLWVRLPCVCWQSMAYSEAGERRAVCWSELCSGWAGCSDGRARP